MRKGKNQFVLRKVYCGSDDLWISLISYSKPASKNTTLLHIHYHYAQICKSLLATVDYSSFDLPVYFYTHIIIYTHAIHDILRLKVCSFIPSSWCMINNLTITLTTISYNYISFLVNNAREQSQNPNISLIVKTINAVYQVELPLANS